MNPKLENRKPKLVPLVAALLLLARAAAAQEAVLHEGAPAIKFASQNGEWVSFIDRRPYEGEDAFRFSVLHIHLGDCYGYLYVTRTRIAYEPVFSPEYRQDAFSALRTGIREAKGNHRGGHWIRVALPQRKYDFWPAIDRGGERQWHRSWRPVVDFFELSANDFGAAESRFWELTAALRPVQPRQGSIGVRFRTTAGDNEALLRSLGATQGIVVDTVRPGSPAEQAGLRPGDVITAVESTPIRTGKELAEKVAATPIGQGLKIQYLRDKQPNETTVVVQEAAKVYPELVKPAAGGTPAAPEAPKTATLAMEVQPGGAEFYIDDEFKGSTSGEGKIKVSGLAPGEHKLRLSRKDYQEWSKTLSLEAGENRTIEVHLEEAKPSAPPPPAETTLALEDVIKLLEGLVTPVRVEAIVKERGVNFALTEENEARLRDVGATDALIIAIAKAKK